MKPLSTVAATTVKRRGRQSWKTAGASVLLHEV